MTDARFRGNSLRSVRAGNEPGSFGPSNETEISAERLMSVSNAQLHVSCVNCESRNDLLQGAANWAPIPEAKDTKLFLSVAYRFSWSLVKFVPTGLSNNCSCT